jgi:hypothetical protein
VKPQSEETRDIHYVTLVASNPRLDLPQDRRPHAMDVSTIKRIATECQRWWWR